MTRALLILLLTAGCSASPDVTDADDGSSSGWNLTGTDMASPDDMSRGLTLSLGSRDVPFIPWSTGAPVIVVAGPQGGFHTEHAVHLAGATVGELHLVVIYGEVWRDDLVLARSGWEFWSDQFESEGAGFRTELPPLVFDEQPEFGDVELRGRAELTDGRTAAFDVVVELVNP